MAPSFLNGPPPFNGPISAPLIKNVPILTSFSFIFGLFKQTIQFLQQINMKNSNVHQVYGAGIQTQDLLNMSCLP